MDGRGIREIRMMSDSKLEKKSWVSHDNFINLIRQCSFLDYFERVFFPLSLLQGIWSISSESSVFFNTSVELKG